MREEMYQLKDIIFGLRIEYLKIQKEIEKLKKLVLENDKRIVEYETCFAITQKTEFPALISRLKIKQGSIEKKINNLESRLKSSKSLIREFEFVIDKETLHQSVGKIKFGKRNGDIRYEYIKKIDSILTSPFSKEVRDTKITEGNIDNLYISCNGISFYKHSDRYQTDINYSKEKDTLSVFRHYPGLITPEYIQHILQFPFAKKFFSDYMQESIEKNREIDKKIEIPNICSCYYGEEFNIIEEDKKIILYNETTKKKVIRK